MAELTTASPKEVEGRKPTATQVDAVEPEHLVRRATEPATTPSSPPGDGDPKPSAATYFASAVPRLEVGPADHPLEREADALADRVLGTPRAADPSDVAVAGPALRRQCDTCAQDEDEPVRRQPVGSRGPDVSSVPKADVQAATSSGRPLDPETRAFFEPRFGRDFGDVRVHTEAAPGRLAAQLGARAFTAGSDIAFGRDQYQPRSAAGKRLLAHELAHVLQGSRRVRRSPEDQSTSDDAYGVCSTELDLGPQECKLDEPDTTEISADYDPCTVDVSALTNAALLSEYRRALAVVQQGRGATGYFDYRNLQRRLVVERDARVGNGHAWLASMPAGVPATLYRIVDGARGTFDVVAVPGDEAKGMPQHEAAPLMTMAQFQAFLAQNRVQQIDGDTFAMMVMPPRIGGLGVAFPGMDPFASNAASIPGLVDPFGLQGLGAAPFGRAADPFGVGIDALSAPGSLAAHGPLAPAPPRDLSGLVMFIPFSGTTVPHATLPSTTVVVPPSPGVELPSVFQPGALAGQTKQDAKLLLANPKALDPAQLDPMRNLLDTYRRVPGIPNRIDEQALRNRGGHATRTGAKAPGSVYGGTVATWRTNIPGLQYHVLDTLGASPQAVPPGLKGTPGWTGGDHYVAIKSTKGPPHAEHVALENLRKAIQDALDAGRITRADLKSKVAHVFVEQVPCSACQSIPTQTSPRGGVIQQFATEFPELTLEVRSADNSRALLYQKGTLLNPHGADAPIKVPADLPETTTTPGRLSTGRAIGASAGVSGLVAVVTSAGIMVFDGQEHPEWGTELLVGGSIGTGSGAVGTGAEMVINQAGQRAMATQGSRLTPGLTTGLGRFGGGAVGALFVEGISMGLLEERYHSGLEVGTRSVRAGVLGGGSVWAGAAAGTAVGGPIGFVVGLLVGGALYYVGDKIVPGGKADWDAYEAGCQPRPTPAPRPAFSSPPFTCFAGDTPILMADGSSRSIRDVEPGEVVLSYDEAADSLEPARVTKLHEHPPAACVRLGFENGSCLRVTAAHHVATPGGWKPVGDLLAGSEVWSVARGEGLERTRVTSFAREDPDGSVFDLSVEKNHCYFADGVLAHNKLP